MQIICRFLLVNILFYFECSSMSHIMPNSMVEGILNVAGESGCLPKEES
jgi:hypothetical protein